MIAENIEKQIIRFIIEKLLLNGKDNEFGVIHCLLVF